MQSSRLDWDDVRVALAVARHGTLAGAARALGVNHATVMRRVGRIEAAAGLALFDRTARGYALAPGRRRVLAAMEDMERASEGLIRALANARAPMAGTVHVTSTDTLCLTVLPGVAAEIAGAAEGVKIDIKAENRHADLARLDADVAVRPAASLPEGLVGTRAARMGFAVYASPEAPAHWLGLSGALSRARPAAWLAEAIPPAQIAASADSFLVLREMAAAGQGRAILPAILGEADPRLRRLDGAMPPLATEIWVATHRDLAGVPRIRLVRDMIAESLGRRAAQLLGPAAANAP
ncbi:MAG: LysR family transcriptional regulator [Alphaproteobacteria bacterium]|nr:MAG: LysR family transcriptional regulator [Alphaproteobacteria bacterium]